MTKREKGYFQVDSAELDKIQDKISDKNRDKIRPGITLVIPVYNRVALIGETLASVAAQSRLPEEVVLVDNGSADGSWEFLFRWKEEMEGRGIGVSVKREVRPGAARARQTGLEFVRTRYVMYFDSDDTMHPDHVEKIMRDFELDPELDLTVWPVTFHSPDGKMRTRRIRASRPIDNHMVQGLLSTQGYAVRTEFLRSCGGWNPGIGGWDDLELGLRLLLNNPKMKISMESRVDMRVQEDSISGMSYAHRMGDWERTLDEMERYVRGGNFAEGNHVLRLIAYRRVILAAHYRAEGYEMESEELLMSAIEMPELSRHDVRLLKLAYRYTSRGLPGAGILFAPYIS